MQSAFIHVQVVFHLLLQGFTVIPLVQRRFLSLTNNKLGANDIYFVIASCPKWGCIIGWTLKSIHALIYVLLCKYSCHIGTMSTQPYTVVKVGVGIDPVTEVTHFRLKVF